MNSDIDGASNDNSGTSVSLSGNGRIVAIGAAGYDDGGSEACHVRVFELQSGVWVKVGPDIDGEAAGDHSGGSVS